MSSMWSEHMDYGMCELALSDTEILGDYGEDDDDDDDGDDVNSDLEAMLYSQVYHSEVQVHTYLTTAPVRVQKTLKPNSEVESVCEAKVSGEMNGSVNDNPMEVLMVTIDDKLSKKCNSTDAACKRHKSVDKDKENDKLSLSKRSCLNIDNDEVVITIKNTVARSDVKKRAVLSSSSSSSSDEDDVLTSKPCDVSQMYAHITDDVSSVAGVTQSSQKCKSKRSKAKKTRLSQSSGAGDTQETVILHKDDLQAACYKAMTHFYTNSNSDGFKTGFLRKDSSAKWAILSSDRHGARQTRGRFFMKCTLCSESGHLAEACPKARKEPRCRLCGENHLMNCCDNRLCTVCWLPWHPFRRCQLLLDSEESPVGCSLCHRIGHVDIQCSDHWRQFHSAIECDEDGVPIVRQGPRQLRSSAETFCYNCGRRGHFGHECYGWRMNVHSVPYVPFVASQREADPGVARRPPGVGGDFEEQGAFRKSASRRNDSMKLRPTSKEAKAARHEKRIELKRLRREERKVKWMALSQLRREAERKNEKRLKKSKKMDHVVEVPGKHEVGAVEKKKKKEKKEKKKSKKCSKSEKVELKRLRREQRKAKTVLDVS